MPSREMRRMQKKVVPDEKKRAQMKKAGKSKGPKKKRTSPMQFLREVKSEMMKVTWPNKHEVVSYTIVVLVTVAITTTFVIIIDIGFTRIIESLLF